MKKIVNVCNLYIINWLLYFFHWKASGIFPLFDVLSNGFLAIGLSMSIYYFFVANIHYSLPSFYKKMNVLLLLFTIYGIISLVSGDSVYVGQWTRLKNGSYLIGPLRSFLPLYAFFVFTKKGLITEKGLLIWASIMFIQTIYCFLSTISYNELDIGERVDGNVYSVVMLLPFLFFFRNKKILQYALLFPMLYFVLIGMKRGAIVTAVLFSLYFIFVTIKGSSGFEKLVVLALLFMFVFWGNNAVSKFYESSSRFQQKIEQTAELNSSGRDDIAKDILKVYLSSNVGRLLFGYGADGSVKTIGAFAHNDWLEMLIDTGLVGLILYLMIWISLYSEWRKNKKGTLIYYILGGCFVVILPRTIFSMGYSHLEISAGLLMAYCMALRNNTEFVFKT